MTPAAPHIFFIFFCCSSLLNIYNHRHHNNNKKTRLGRVFPGTLITSQGQFSAVRGCGVCSPRGEQSHIHEMSSSASALLDEGWASSSLAVPTLTESTLSRCAEPLKGPFVSFSQRLRDKTNGSFSCELLRSAGVTLAYRPGGAPSPPAGNLPLPVLTNVGPV